MNKKRYVIMSIVVWLVFFLIEFFAHVTILGSSYSSHTEFMRTGGSDVMVLNVVGGLIFSFLFCYIFIKGYEGKGIIEGFRFGIIIGAFIWLPKMIFEYANFNFPGSWPLIWFIFGVIASVFGGIISALIYRPIKKIE